MYMKDRKSIRNKEKGALRSFVMPFDARGFVFFFCHFLKRIAIKNQIACSITFGFWADHSLHRIPVENREKVAYNLYE